MQIFRHEFTTTASSARRSRKNSRLSRLRNAYSRQEGPPAPARQTGKKRTQMVCDMHLGAIGYGRGLAGRGHKSDQRTLGAKK